MLKWQLCKDPLMDFFPRPIFCSYGSIVSEKLTPNFVAIRKGLEEPPATCALGLQNSMNGPMNVFAGRFFSLCVRNSQKMHLALFMHPKKVSFFTSLNIHDTESV